MSIYFYAYYYMANVSFINCQAQAIISLKHGYVLQVKSSISSTVIYLACIFFHLHP